jgi:hypothetical protein
VHGAEVGEADSFCVLWSQSHCLRLEFWSGRVCGGGCWSLSRHELLLAGLSDSILPNRQLGDMEIVYKFHADAAFYRTTIDRYYGQRPLLLRLPVQYGIFGLVLIGVVLWSAKSISPTLVVIAVSAAVAIIFGLVELTKLVILRRFRRRADFGTEATVIVSEAGIASSGRHVEGRWEWRAFPRAVRFDDGILLLRAGVIRWLPDAAIQTGTPRAATALVKSNSELRDASGRA